MKENEEKSIGNIARALERERALLEPFELPDEDDGEVEDQYNIICMLHMSSNIDTLYPNILRIPWSGTNHHRPIFEVIS